MSLFKKFILIVLAGVLVYFGSWLIVYKLGINTLPIQSEDTVPAMFIPVTIIKEQTLYLDDYYAMMLHRYPNPDDKQFEKGLLPFYLKKVGDHYLSAFTIMTPLLALPVYFVPVLMGMEVTWENLILLSHLAAAVISALAGGFFFLLVHKYFSEKHAPLLTFIYMFGTINFALISQALWQHGALQLFCILGMYFFLGASGTLKNLFYAGLFFGLAVLSRPTAGLAFGFFGILLLFTSKNLTDAVKRSLFYVAGLLPSICFFLWYNAKFYVEISNQGYTGQLLRSWLSPFPVSFLGVWLSPSKGILTYSPVLIFALIGLYIVLKRKGSGIRDNYFLIFTMLVFSHTLIISFWKHWFGGWSFGYRMSSDILPFLVLLLVPFLESDFFVGRNRRLFVVLFGISVAVQLMGLGFFDGIWHSAYDKGFTDTGWLWSIADSEVVFNVRRVLVKLGVFTRACPQCL